MTSKEKTVGSDFYDELRRAADQLEEEVRIIRECEKAGRDYTLSLLRQRLPAFAERFPSERVKTAVDLAVVAATQNVDLSPEQVAEARDQLTRENDILASLPFKEVTSTTYVGTTAPTLSIEDMIRGAIARDPETGTIPTEPGAPSESLPVRPGGAVPGTPADAVETTSEAAQTGSAAGPALPPGTGPMEGAPKDGTEVVLYYRSLGELHQEFAKWSSEFGRQFWVDLDGETLGMDDKFEGFRLLTAAEKQEMEG